MEQDERGLYGIYDIWHKPFWQTSTFYLIVSVLIGIVLLFLLYFVVRWVRSKKQVAELSAWEQALQQFKLLQEKEITTKQDGKNIYTTLSFELKQYLYKRYGYEVRWKTDEEVLNYLERNEFSSELLCDLRNVMSGSVMVKFANIQAVNEQVKNHLNLSITFIQKTMPQQATQSH